MPHSPTFVVSIQILGTAGVELLTNCMNNYFTKVISLISSFDGDVVKFAGGFLLGNNYLLKVAPLPALYFKSTSSSGPHSIYRMCVQVTR